MAEEIESPQGAEKPSDETQGQQPPPGEAQQETPPEEVSEDARLWAMLCHLLGLFTNFIAPLIIWLVKKEEEPFVDKNGKEALNFQITVAIAAIVSGALCFACVGFFLLPAVGVLDLVFCIIAAIKANSGQVYRYPISIRFIK